MADTAAQYKPALLTAEATHRALATGMPIGKRFHFAPAIRIGDGKQLQLGELFLADGR